MPRKKTKSLERKVAGDRKYDSELVQRLINKVMLDGKKARAESEVYAAIEKLAKDTKSKDPLEAFITAMDNIYPDMETRSRRVGGANYQIPFPVKGRRRRHLAMMWLVEAARSRRKGSSKTFGQALGEELIDATKEAGSAVKKKEDVHKMAESNRAFAHFAR